MTTVFITEPIHEEGVAIRGRPEPAVENVRVVLATIGRAAPYAGGRRREAIGRLDDGARSFRPIVDPCDGTARAGRR